MKYIEFCAGIGGMTAGLNAAGWSCAMAVDNDPDAVAVHRLAHGQCELADVTKIDPSDLPDADAWVAGFPCQPFSSSGHRSGFGHSSGNVFEHLVRLIEIKQPNLLLLENVEGLLNNKSGHTISVILSKLNALGFSVNWLLVDLRWFGIPQTRPRLFLVSYKRESLLKPQPLTIKTGGLFDAKVLRESIYTILLNKISSNVDFLAEGDLDKTESILRPAIGKAQSALASNPFKSLGIASDGKFATFNISNPTHASLRFSLGDVVAPNFKNKEKLRSGRYYARGGPTRLCLRTEAVSHCVGTSLGGAPLFAVKLDQIKRASDRKDFLEFANWHREQDGLLVMRLRPDRAVRLFGPQTDELHHAVSTWNAGDTRKYKLVGNMVAPICAKTVAELINEQIGQ